MFRLAFCVVGLVCGVAFAQGPPPMINARGDVEYKVTENDFAPDFVHARKNPHAPPVPIPPQLKPADPDDCPDTIVI